MDIVRTARSLAPLAAAFLLAGCLEATGKSKIAADGTGTVSQTWKIDLATFAQIQEMMKMMGGPQAPAAADVPEVDKADVFVRMMKTRAEGTPGLKIEKFEDVTKDGTRTLTVQGRFSNLECLAKSFLVAPGGAEVKKKEDGSYASTWRYGFAMSPEAMGGFDLGSVAAMLEPLLSGLSYEQTITFPGKVSATNGTKAEDGTTVSFSAAFKDVMSDKPEWTATFSGAGLEFADFNVQPDVMDLMRRFQETEKKMDAEAIEKEDAAGGAAVGAGMDDAAMGGPAKTEPAMTDAK